MHEQNGWYETDPPPNTNTEKGTEVGFKSDSKEVGFSGTMQTEMESKDVLVVDDDPHLCAIMSDVLEAEGHTARMAANGEEALQRIRERKPQLILLDLMMPVMNGWELAATLRGHPEWTDIPIVVVTAAHNGSGGGKQELNAKAVIHKPFDIDALTEVVLEHAQKDSS